MSSSFFEGVAARLVPFDFTFIPDAKAASAGHPLAPIFQTGGLVFPYTPAINETIKMTYDRYDLVHSNESYYAYKNTENRRITISSAVFTCDTPENARYALAALHFFWIYSLMDFGKGKTGRPPSPMWFSAYGNFAFNKVPVLVEGCDIQWPDGKDVDYVRVPNPGTSSTSSAGNLVTRSGGILSQALDTGGDYTWLPAKLEITNISLIVQHSPKFWKGGAQGQFSLEDYRTGRMASRDGSSDNSTAGTSLPGRFAGISGSAQSLLGGLTGSSNIAQVTQDALGGLSGSADVVGPELDQVRAQLGSRLAQTRELESALPSVSPSILGQKSLGSLSTSIFKLFG